VLTERIARIYPLPYKEKINISVIDCTLWAWRKQSVCNFGLSMIKTLIKEKLLIQEQIRRGGRGAQEPPNTRNSIGGKWEGVGERGKEEQNRKKEWSSWTKDS